MLSVGTLAALLEFRRQREWEQFHSPKNLAVAIAVEAGELLEQFQWTTDHDAPRNMGDGQRQVEAEVADLCILLSYLVHDLSIDLDGAVRNKLAENALRYPVEKSRGNAAKYDELE